AIAPDDLRHGFAEIAGAASDIENALASRQIKLPDCLRALRLDVSSKIVFYEPFRIFFAEFHPAHVSLRSGITNLGVRGCVGLDSQHCVVGIAEHKYLRGSPDDLFQIDECTHLQPILPKHQMLNEVPGQPPGPERQS